MPKIKYYYSPSINIVRDLNKDLEYISTPNAKQVYTHIAKNYTTGTHSFNIVGSYGTGKSSFLLALEHHLNGEKDYFSPLNGSFKGVKGFEFLPIIGESTSLLNYFAIEFGLKNKDYNTRDILKKIEANYTEISKSGKGWLIAIDEFGKFLEYAANNNPEKELYFIQQLAEFANDDSKNILFVTTLHQGFNDYAIGLSKTQRNEWDKIRGRLKEITFNEPVEQLLLLAAERISSRQQEVKKGKTFNQLFDSIADSKTFPLNDYFNKSIAEKLLPFDILSASILTSALQRYGQNERSLFQFVDSNDYLGLEDFDTKTNPFYNISCVYDYLMYNYYSTLTTKHNQDYSQWATIRNSIERLESELVDYVSEGTKLIKTIGLLNIFAPNSGTIDRDFLVDYSKFSLGFNNAEEVLDKLSQFKIISFTKYDRRYKLLGGTDLDIDQAIADAEIDDIADVVPYLNKYFDFPYIQAKEHFYRTGCPRFFQFKISEKPYNEIIEDADGIVNLVFSEKDIKQELLQQSQNSNEPILYCLYDNIKDIRNTLIELERIQYVKRQYPSDKVAQREIDKMLVRYKKTLNELVFEGLFDNNKTVWLCNGSTAHIQSHKQLNRQLSDICDWAYPATPVFRNEMVNKGKLSGAMQPARRNLIKALVSNFDKPNLGFPDEKFPPEKTIYLSLLKNTGIHNGYALAKPLDESFNALWDECIRFLYDAKATRMGVHVLVERLQKKPLKLKQGFIDFWLPIFLFICRDEYALFDENGYIPSIDDETLVLVSRQPDSFEIKSFDISGIKLDLFNSYRSFLNIEEADTVTNDSLIELIKPFLIFYAQLPEYGKRTKRISKQAIILRDAIALSKEPEKTFFEDFPKAMGISLEKIAKNPELVRDYIDTLQALVREIRTAYEELINRIENFIQSEFIGEEVPFVQYKEILKQRFKKLKKHLLLPKQKVFYQRLMSELDVRNAWISSTCQVLIGKSLDTISDEEEKVLYENFRDMINELDNLCNLAKSDVNLDTEEVFKLEITSFIKGLQKHTIRYPKGKTEEIKELEADIKSRLSNDKNANIALLLDLLQNEIDGK
ncbi:hypothetical protein [Proteiniphilum sp. X52]|uniref:hypothetical protein n=1 Tax=Proteiniphilum sp. X52 TaxID=2382159 RepID=UPI0011CE121B|nr:hypothetical protein [Proteiniphilum sp. X52]